jgi:ATP-dependent exoDNAse (exonuclease V) beta subunit
MTAPNYLSTLNSHPRDDLITFDEGPHIYTIKDDPSQYTSVTTWNHSHFEHFDANKIIDNMMHSKNWKTNKYYGMTKEEIIATWDKSRDEASGAGTKMHYDIECYYNQCPNENTSLEYSYFLKFAKDYKHLKPYRTEWMIWHEDIKVAGSVDMVFEQADGTLLIYDWKRSKEITKTTGFNKFAITESINHLPDTNFWHYSLQLNVYKRILEEKYGKRVEGLFLVCLHPNNKNQSYLRIPCADLQNEIGELFELRKQQILTQNNLNISNHL